MTKLEDMKTNEKMRNKSDRRIPLTLYDIFYEILGNMKGNKMFIFLENDTLYAYNNDNGFTEEDKKGLHEKNCSGNNEKTAGINGHGIKLVIDRLLPDDTAEKEASAEVFSINDKKKSKIGHFKYSPWMDFSHDDLSYVDKYKTGSLFKIPLTEKYINEINNNESDLILACLKYLNILINEEDFSFEWNNKPQKIDKICPDKRSVTLDYCLGYDVKTDDLQEGHKKTLLLRIDNIESNNISSPSLDEFRKISMIKLHKDFNKRHIKNYDPKFKFKEIEKGRIKLNIVANTDKNHSKHVSLWDGLQVYLHKHCINYKAIVKNLGGRTAEGVFGNDTYKGKPRFENHIQKNSVQFDLPADKSNIKSTSKGDLVLKFIQIVAKIIYVNDDTFVANNTEDTDNVVSATSAGTTDNVVSATSAGTTDNVVFAPSAGICCTNAGTCCCTDDTTSPDRNIRYSLKEEVWRRAFGDKFNGRCFCCGKLLKANWNPGRDELQFGHMLSWADNKENKWHNLVPVCKGCNGSMGSEHMDEWTKRTYPDNYDNYLRRKKEYLESTY